MVTGAGLGERRDGGLAERVAVDPAWAVEVPPPFTPAHAAAIGTAGVTAALSVLRLQQLAPPAGPVLVTGAGGGVGGFAVALLAASGFEVIASTGRGDELGEHLRALGADGGRAAASRPSPGARCSRSAGPRWSTPWAARPSSTRSRRRRRAAS